jgi:3-hydroxybutyryl-CoA dehydrogenase
MSPNNKPKVAIIGGGTMGIGISAVFAGGGWEVYVVESSSKARKVFPAKVAATLENSGVDPNESCHVLASLEEIIWDNVEICVECVSEELSLKQKVFSQLEDLSPTDIPLASNSSSFPVSRIAIGLQTQSRMLGLHFFMPAHLVPLVEVISSRFTSSVVVKRASDIMTKLGKRPVHVKKDIPGFLANRIQHALMREAISLVEKGIASVEDVDTAVRYGFGFRFIAAGPMLQKDLSGLDINYHAAEQIYPDLCNQPSPSTFLAEKVAKGHIGVKAMQGFYDWTPESVAKEKSRYEKMLQAALRILHEEGLAPF